MVVGGIGKSISVKVGLCTDGLGDKSAALLLQAFGCRLASASAEGTRPGRTGRPYAEEGFSSPSWVGLVEKFGDGAAGILCDCNEAEEVVESFRGRFACETGDGAEGRGGSAMCIRR